MAVDPAAASGFAATTGLTLAIALGAVAVAAYLLGLRRGEDRGRRDQGGLHEAARRLADKVEDVERSSLSLREALRGDRQARGRWGEVQLQTLVESVGLAPGLDFDVQPEVGGLRPDFVFRLPGGERLAVDVKTPMDDFLRAAEAPEEAAEHGARHAGRVRAHVHELAQRDYPGLLGDGPPFTVMFLPVEALLAEAMRHDSDLLRFAAGRRVVLTTPHTLLGLLWAISTLWRGERRVRNAESLADEALEAERRLGKFLEHFAEAGGRLRQAADAYNAAVGSAESRLVPQLRRLRELSGRPHGEEGLPKPVEAAVRPPPETD